MSNRTLIIAIAVILLLAGAAVAAMRAKNKSAEFTQTPPQANLNQDIPASAFPTSTPATSTPEVAQNFQVKPETLNGCSRVFDPNKLKNDQVSIKNRQVQVTVKNFGNIKLEFYDHDAPKAVENFLRLANSGYYDCLTFHRVAKGFVIQGGDPKGDGTDGQSAFGAPFADELNPNTQSYKTGYVKGVLAMANSGANTNGSQFFIMLADNQLQHDYTIFGKVIAGQEVVDKIGQVDITPQMGPTDGSPKTPVVMESVRITK